MSGGKSGSSGTTYNTTTLTPEQREQIQAQTGFFTNTIAPTYNTAVKGATDIYNQSAPGFTNASQNLAGVAGQAQQSLGETGESALRTGISGLENLFDADYESQQLNAALQPAQAQYQQNIANQGAQFGGAGQIGSARQALAGQQLAGSNMATQQQTAAQVMNNIASQRSGAATTLAQLGQGGIGQSLGAAGQQVTAAKNPMDLYNQYASVIFGTPSASYNPDFRGTQSSTVNTNNSAYQMGFGGSYGSSSMADMRNALK